MLIADIVITGVIILAFLIFKPDGVIPIAAAAAAAVAAHVGAEKIIGEKKEEEAKGSKEYWASRSEVMPELLKASEDLYTDAAPTKGAEETGEEAKSAAESFGQSIKEFQTRKKALYRIMDLTEYINAGYIENASDITEKYLLQLADALRIKLTILMAVGRRDYQYESTCEDIKAILRKADEITDRYSDLLAEAGRMKDGSDDSTEKLTHAVEKLKAAREEYNKAFVVQNDGIPMPGGTRNYGI